MQRHGGGLSAGVARARADAVIAYHEAREPLDLLPRGSWEQLLAEELALAFRLHRVERRR